MLDIAKPTNAGDQGAPPRPGSRRRLFLAAVVLVLVVAAGFGAWARFFSPVKVTVAHPAADVAVQVFGLGTIEARVTSKIGFKISGILVDLRADVGNRVAKGAVLARLDDREQKAQVARSKAVVEQAEANLQKANASVQKAMANYDNAKRISERRQQLVLSKTTSVEAAETAKAVQDAAFGDLNLAKSDVAVATATISDCKGASAAARSHLGFPHADRALRRHGDGAAEGARLRACRQRAGLHVD